MSGREYIKKMARKADQDNDYGLGPRRKAIGRTKDGNYVYPSKKTEDHMFVCGKTGAGKTTLLQKLMEIEYYRNNKVIEIEPAKEGKNERGFMNLPTADDEMRITLRKKFGLEPRPFKTKMYSLNTERLRNFLKKHPVAEKFFEPIKIEEKDVIDVLPHIFPSSGSGHELNALENAYSTYTAKRDRKDYSLREYIRETKDRVEGSNLNPDNIERNINDISDTLLIGANKGKDGTKIEEILNKTNEISVFTTHFINFTQQQLRFAMAVFNLTYNKWVKIPSKEAELRFFLSDADQLLPRNPRGQGEDLQRTMKSKFIDKLRGSRSKGVRWHLDSQAFHDLDEVALQQTEERYINRLKNKKVAKDHDIDYNVLGTLPVHQAFQTGGLFPVRLENVCPPQSYKAGTELYVEKEHVPIHFIKTFKRWKNEKDNYTIPD